jgi:hypothetical protein
LKEEQKRYFKERALLKIENWRTGIIAFLRIESGASLEGNRGANETSR